LTLTEHGTVAVSEQEHYLRDPTRVDGVGVGQAIGELFQDIDRIKHGAAASRHPRIEGTMDSGRVGLECADFVCQPTTSLRAYQPVRVE
jgi:hypothetical protein